MLILPEFRPSHLLLLFAFFIFNGNGISSRQSNDDSRTFLFFGDSITAGYGLTPEQAFPALIQKKFQEEKIPVNVINGGLSGETTAGGLRRIDWMLKQKVDVLILELGANDGLRGIPLNDTGKNLQSIIDRVKKKYPNIIVIIAGMQVPPNLGGDYAKAFMEIFPALAAKNDAMLIPFILEGVGGIPELNLSDRIHPNRAGHEIIAHKIWGTMNKAWLMLKKGQKIEGRK